MTLDNAAWPLLDQQTIAGCPTAADDDDRSPGPPVLDALRIEEERSS